MNVKVLQHAIAEAERQERILRKAQAALQVGDIAGEAVERVRRNLDRLQGPLMEVGSVSAGMLAFSDTITTIPRDLARLPDLGADVRAFYDKLAAGPKIDLSRIADTITTLARHLAPLPDLNADVRAFHDKLAAGPTIDLSEIADSITTIARDLAPLPDRLSESMSQLASGFGKHEEALRRLATFPELDQLQRVIAQHQRAVAAAESAQARTERTKAMLVAMAEGITGLELHLEDPVKRVKLLGQLIRWLVTFLLMLQPTPTQRVGSDRASEDAKRARAELRQQAETITAIAETLRQIQEQLSAGATRKSADLRVHKLARLREGPYASTPRITKLTVGTQLHFITTVERWSYVEVLDANGKGTDVRGWVLRRNVRRIKI